MTDAIRAALRESSGKWFVVNLDGDDYEVRSYLNAEAVTRAKAEDFEGLVQSLFRDSDRAMVEVSIQSLVSLLEVLAGGPGNSEPSTG